jgi:two-component system CheB/CheR fusion protein
MAKILLIEDNPDAAEMLGMLLEFQGHLVARATSGQAGIALADTFLPHVIIVDLLLPDIDGIDIIASLRSTAHHRTSLILALTNVNDMETRERARSAGVDHFFAKDEDVGALLSLIDAH